MRTGRRVLAAVIVLCMVVGMIKYPKGIRQAKAAVPEDFQYELLTDGTVSITKYTGTDAVLAIPGQIDGKTVTKIGERAFQDCGTLIEVTFPDSIESMELCAFVGCTNLQKIAFANGLQSIGAYAFSTCTKLTEVSIPDGVIMVGSNVFSGCSSLEKVILPDSVLSIGEYAFKDCTSLTAINFPEKLTSIERSVLQNCGALTEVVIPEGVTSIGKMAFQDCRGITEISIQGSIGSIGDFAFNRCESLQSIAIPDSVTQIGVTAFANCKNLTEIVIPDSVTQIGESIFSCCDKLVNVILSKNLSVISGSMFEACTGLKEITIPEKVTSIEDNAFIGCTGLSSVYLPKSVTSIKGLAFSSCRNLKDIYYSGTLEQWNQITIDPKSGLSASVTIHYNENSGEETDFEYRELDDGTIEITKYNGSEAVVEIPTQIDSKSVTSIGNKAFYDSAGLTKISIPNDVTNIGEEAFANCNDLKTINIPEGMISIGNSAFSWCDALQEINIPNNLISIGEYAFNHCGALQEINIPDSVTYMGDHAFIGCSAIREINIPSNIISIGNYVFDQCSSLQKINIPNNVTSIGNYAFAWCSALQEINIPHNIASIGEKSFYDCSSLTDVYYDGTEEQWNQINLAVDSGLENERTTIHFKAPDETEKDYEYQVLEDDTIEITKYTGTSEAVTIPAKLTGRDVTKLAAEAFGNHENITEITIPACLTDIHREAFKDCPNLTTIRVDAANENYCTEDGVLFNKAKTELIRYPEGKSGAYTVPSGVISIGDYAFYNCNQLTEATVSDGVTTIGSHAFAYSTNMKSIHIPIGVTEIKGYTFQGCKGLEEFVVPDGVTAVDIGAFNYCENLKMLTIPASTVQIHRNFFVYGIVVPYSLKDVYFGGTKEQWEQIEVPGYSEGSASVSKKLLLDYLNATVHFENGPIILPEEPIQPEVRDPKQELDSLKSNGSFQLDEFAHYLTEEQISILEDYLYTWLAQVNHAYQYAGSSDIKELMMKKAGIDPDGNFASGTEQAITHISVDTPYGTKTLEITMGLGQPDSSGNLYPGYSVMHYEILEKNGIPSDVPVSGQIVRNGYTDMGAFVESVKQASNDSLHSVYQWQQLEPETAAGILIDKATAEIVGNKNGSFADGTFTIYAKPLFAYSKIVKISCPVDVHVYGMDGKEAGSIVNNQPSGGNQHVRLDMDGETKTVYLAGEDYYLNLRGTGTGKMKYEVEEIANEEVRRNVQFLELQLKNDMLYEGYVFRPLNIDRDLYALRAVEKDGTGGEVFHSNQDSYQSSFKKVQGLSLSQKNTSLESDRTIQLSASYFPLDASNPNLRWTTNNASVARVDENGLITAVGSGQATVTVSTKDGSFLKQYCVIDVSKKGGGNGSGGSTGSGSENNGGNGTGGSGSDSGNNGTGSGDGNGGNNTTPGDSINGSGSGSSGNGTGSGSNGSSGSSTSGNSSGNGSDSSTTDGQDQTPVVVSLHYVLQFHANGGTNLSRRTMTLLADDNPGIMPKVQRKDYTFDGWYTKQEGGKRITGDDPLTEASTLYARWIKTQAPAKVSALTVKSKKKGQLQASFQKVKGAAGYQVAYSGSKKFTSVKKKEAGANVKTKTLTGLKAGKKYYIKVRAYRVDSAGNRIYGAYSAVKSVKTKA